MFFCYATGNNCGATEIVSLLFVHCILYELHWPPIQARIKFKIILFAFKVVHNLALSCINSLLSI